MFGRKVCSFVDCDTSTWSCTKTLEMYRSYVVIATYVFCGFLFRIPLAANYIPVRCRSEGLFQYDIAFNPPVVNERLKFKLVHMIENQIGRQHIFLGSVLCLPHRLPDKVGKLSFLV